MTMASPGWLILALPLALLIATFPARSRLQTGLRIAAYALIVCGLSGLEIRTERRSGTVVVIADRSLSMPPGAADAQLEAYELLHEGKGREDRIAMVSFGSDVAVDRPPGHAALDSFQSEVSPSASNLGAALRRAFSLLPSGEAGSILLISDGLATDTSALVEAASAGGQGIRIDYRRLARPPVGDVSIARIDAPLRVNERDSFIINAYVYADVATGARYTLRRGNDVIASGETTLEPGRTRLTFRERAGSATLLNYRLTVETEADDPITENNTARHLVGVQVGRPVLIATNTPGGGLVASLRANGINAIAHPPDAIDWSLESLSSYAAIVIENIAIQDIGFDGAQNIAAVVEHLGVGLMMTGGRRSFASGGWHQSPVDPILPVSLELRQDFRKLATSIMITMDRSGSMGARARDGRTKIQLAGLAAQSVLDLLTPIDRMGVLAVDTRPNVIVPLSKVTDSDRVSDRLRSIRAEGGGIYIYVALAAAAKPLLDIEQGTRHIILLADAMDSVEALDYQKLLKTLADVGITVSVVGLGTKRDSHAPLLKDIAGRGGGRIFFTDDARMLPQLFSQDAVAVTHGAFLSERTAVRTTGLLAALSGTDFSGMPAIGGYNPTFLKPDASAGALTEDEYAAPFIAYWSAGAGRVVAYTAEVDGDATGPIGRWERTGGLLASLAGWAAGEIDPLPTSMAVSQQIEGSVLRVTLDVGDEAQTSLDNPRLLLVRRREGVETTREVVALRYADYDRLRAEVPIDSDEVVAAALRINDDTIVQLSPVTRMYSPEYQPPAERSGEQLLRAIARHTGGQERSDLGGMWNNMPLVIRSVALAPWLFSLAIVALLLEVADRRMGILAGVRERSVQVVASGRERLRRTSSQPADRGRVGKSRQPTQQGRTTAATTPTAPPAATKDRSPDLGDQTGESGLLDAMRSVRKK